MPHLIIERLRGVPSMMPTPYSGVGECVGREGKGNRRSPVCSVVVEIADILGGIVFVLGSICFFPSMSSDIGVLKLGCEFFVVGSAIYALVSFYAFLEAVELKGICALEPCENTLYVAGSSVYLVGTILFWPGDVDTETLSVLVSRKISTEKMHVHVALNTLTPEFEGSVLCIVGCLFFALAAFVNALNIRAFNDVSSQLLSAVTSIYMCGSLLFVMGSVAFLPDFGCSEKMVTLGAWMYTLGSVLYTLGSGISMFRTLREINSPTWQPVESQTLKRSNSELESCIGARSSVTSLWRQKEGGTERFNYRSATK